MATKPMKRAKRFDEGDLVTGTTNVRTRSDDVIGDTNPRTGVYTPGSYDRNRANGEENLKAVKGLWNRITGGSSDDSGTGTRGIKASVSDTKYEPTKSSVADYIGKSTEPKSTESKSSAFNSSNVKGTPAFGDYSGTSKSDDSGSKSSASETETKRTDASSSGDEMTKYAKDYKADDVKESVKKADSKIDEAIKKKKAAADKAKADDNTSKKSEDTNPVPKNFGTLVNPYQQKKTETKSADTKKADTKKSEDNKATTKTDYYRGSDGKMHPKTPDSPPKSEDEWGTQNIRRNLQNAPGDIMSGIKKVGSALSNFETIAERRSREAKEAKNKPVAKRSGGAVKKMASGGSVKSSASSRGDGIASRGKTRGRIC
jgi:hypothetical protein